MKYFFQRLLKKQNQKLVGGFNPFKNISQIGWFPQIGAKIKNVWNHHPEKKEGPRMALDVPLPFSNFCSPTNLCPWDVLTCSSTRCPPPVQPMASSVQGANHLKWSIHYKRGKNTNITDTTWIYIIIICLCNIYLHTLLMAVCGGVILHQL